MIRSVLASAGVVGVLVAGCGSSTSGLSTAVKSVTGTYESYNPALRGGGIPAEQVDFLVTGYTTGPLVCQIEVLNMSGHKVGSTVAQAATDDNGTGKIDESIPVEITGNPFIGSSANAKVSCKIGR